MPGFLLRCRPYLRNPQLLSLAGNLAASGFTVASVALLFRLLPPAQLGVWVFFLAMQGLMEAFRSGWLTTAFIRAYAGAAPARAAEVQGSAWMLALVLTAGPGLLGLLAGQWPAWNASLSLGLFLRWFPLLLALTLPSFMATCTQQAGQRFDRLLGLRLLGQVAFLTGIGGLLLLGRVSLPGVVYCQLGAAALTSAVVLGRGWAGLCSLRHGSAAGVRELARFGRYSVGSYIGSYLLRSSDTVLITLLLGPAALAVYNLAQRFQELIEIPLRSVTATALPRLAAAANRHDRAGMAALLERQAGLLTWLLLPVVVGTVLLAEVPISLIGGRQYLGTEAAGVLRLTISMAVLLPLDRFTGLALDVLGRPQLNLLKVLLMLAVNVVGDLVGIHLTHSIYGVALASLPTILVGFVFGFRLLRRDLPVEAGGMLRVGWRAAGRRLARLASVVFRRPNPSTPALPLP
ncbi:lipopolysaccharide biosynthesis protein [Hymenobacter rigui]|uniref:Lipopolysaccharide biosynthesis protein n=1 Tax=Hymenobacter rigui TaxID=334424 RepID=A0A3R9NTE7_9BACT|nr:oligosaccharide flippase family protein [Hymenobacter rigui]RSK43150.1 lipopolysaccharide biosynthesis protein [Hymenobacter rigui]